MRYNFACVLAGYVGDKEEALRLLESVLVMSGEMHLKIAETDPDLDPLRDHPRFEKLMERQRKAAMNSRTPTAASANPPAAS